MYGVEGAEARNVVGIGGLVDVDAPMIGDFNVRVEEDISTEEFKTRRNHLTQ